MDWAEAMAVIATRATSEKQVFMWGLLEEIYPLSKRSYRRLLQMLAKSPSHRITAQHCPTRPVSHAIQCFISGIIAIHRGRTNGHRQCSGIRNRIGGSHIHQQQNV